MRIFLLVIVLLASIAKAEVVDKSANGFLIKTIMMVPGTPTKVYAAIVEVASWWQSNHTFSGSAKNLSIDPAAGGCFCEKLPSGGSVQHMTVIYTDPGKILRMSGALGPMQGFGIAGTLTFELKASGSNTEITMMYSASGYFQGGIQTIAEPADQMLGGQLASLKSYLSR